MMYRKFIASILATAVAITGLTAAPARADNEDLLKILGGVAAIAIIGSAIKEARDDDKVSRNYPYYYGQRKKAHRRHHKHHHHSHRDRHHGAKDGRYRDDRHARPLPRRVQRKLLPASCQVRARNRGQNFLAYSDWCLDRKYSHARSLPRNCAVNARILHNNKRNTVYGSRCLSRYGYVAARY
ncbi:hypothetical protein AAFO92_21390 [Roseovarius sp. CAU 1744]|uniref:hypothetical protein n=1 Tax=Roseovarius sp. CAU 1744 TaxID=3140368 RepID=UPI00325C0B70